MREKIKKIGKILLITLGSLILLGFVSVFILNIASKSRSIYKQSNVDYAQETIGFGSVAPSLSLKSKGVGGSESTGYDSNTQEEGDLTEKKIIKNGELNLYVKSAERVVESIRNLALSLDGFVSNSYIYKTSSGRKSGNVTIRVPAKSFMKAMNDIKQLAEEVESERTSTRDVTEEYIDYQAQLKNLQAEEEQYLEIMDRSFTVEDMLKVSSRLSDVRGRIERIQGKLQYLSRQVDMSTIRITLTADEDVEVLGLRWRPLVVVKRAFKDMLSGLTDYVDAIIVMIFKLPVIILWFTTIVLILALAWRILKWIYRKLFAQYSDEQKKENSL
jgi:hypothetical protein